MAHNGIVRVAGIERHDGEQSFSWSPGPRSKTTHGPWFYFIFSSWKRRGGGNPTPAPGGRGTTGGNGCPGRQSGRERQLCRRGPFGRTTNLHPRGLLDEGKMEPAVSEEPKPQRTLTNPGGDPFFFFFLEV
ncbi:hypothetical protein CKAH01_02790 [Colletotrichum kahawae]|uniref:Uncharacterized protein n=1 Tax=Colletotrichum kahawae TaxID=34407 RepID=A0AAD9XWN3_COLKA|nr:hypothetical protein CKAH01_02790 [Colletotrichum kahawae]